MWRIVSHSAQAVELDLSEYIGRVPIELNDGSPFPPIGQLTYLLTLPPYGFYWFVLATASDWPSWHTPAPEPMPEFETIVIRGNLGNGASRRGARQLSSVNRCRNILRSAVGSAEESDASQRAQIANYAIRRRRRRIHF